VQLTTAAGGPRGWRGGSRTEQRAHAIGDGGCS
jgi:hypothetical protein